MTAFALRRIGISLVVLVGASLLVFLVVFALPGDPLAAFGGGRGLTPAARAALEQRYHVHDSLPTQYGRWVVRLLHGDLGDSRISRRPVREIIADALPNTIRLTAAAFTIELVIGLAAGVFAAVTKRSFLKALLLVTMTAAVTVPIFVVATSAQYFVGVRWGILPVSGTEAGIRSWILPALVLALPSIALICRITQTSVERSGTSGYVELAVAKGVAPRRIITHHRLRNGLVPVVTFLGLDIAALFGSALFVETVFNIPGLGLAVSRGVLQHDAELVVGCSLVLIVVFIIANLVVDITVAALDPRTQDD